jgi:hypothetical protein
MSEETPFWGVGTPNAFRANLLMLWRDASSPGSKVYPVFDSKKEAEDFSCGPLMCVAQEIPTSEALHC